MDRTGLRVVSAAVTAAILSCDAGQARIQPPAPATPKRPAASRTPATSAVSTPASVRVDRTTISESLAQILSGRSFNSLPEKRQNIDLVDVPLKEALKRVLEDSKMPYVLDDDVPNEPKVSIKLTDAPLATILDALTLSNRIGWRTEMKRTTTTSSTTKPAEPVDKAKVEKEASVGVGRTYFNSATASGNYVTQIHVGKTITAVPTSFPFRAVTIPGPPASAPQEFLRGGLSTDSPQLRIYRWQNQKRTFTCPRCHNTVSILQQPEEVKCSKCTRTFEDKWKVCPYDGTKRPESKTAWKFCPICGKTITVEASWSEFVDLGDYLLTVPVNSEFGHSAIETLRFLPNILNEQVAPEGQGCSDHEHTHHSLPA